MSVVKIKNALFMGLLFAFVTIVAALHCIFTLQSEDNDTYRTILGLSMLFGGILLMNFIFFYGDGEELVFSSLLWLLPGGYLLIRGYQILLNVSTDFFSTGVPLHNLEVGVLFFTALMLLAAAIVFKHRSALKIRLSYGLAGLVLLLANSGLIAIILPDFYIPATVILEIIGLLLFGSGAFLDVAAYED